MAKANPLAQGLERISRPARPSVPPARQPKAEKPAPRASRAPSRKGQTLIGGFFDPEVHKQLKVMAAEQGTTQQALLADALNMLFAKSGKPEIASLGRVLEPAEEA